MLQELGTGKELALGCISGAITGLAGLSEIDIDQIRTVRASAMLLDRVPTKT